MSRSRSATRLRKPLATNDSFSSPELGDKVDTSRENTPVTSPDHDELPSERTLASRARVKQAVARQGRIFHSINYKPRVSALHPANDGRTDFHGFFSLFWISVAIMIITSVARNISETGLLLRVHLWDMLTANVFSMAAVDFFMVATTAFSYSIHKSIRESGAKGWLRWSRGGLWLQSFFELSWLAFWIFLPFHLQWTWTAQVFLVLHTITLLMKMHSYAFYNGHLSECELELEMLDILQKGTPSSGTDTPTGADTPTGSDTPTSDSADDGGTVDRPMLYHRRKVLADELTSPLGNVTYPNNVTFLNYIDFVCCPTLCYEIEYPRVPEIRWHKLAQDTLAVFGCVGLMILISGEFIFPVLHESSAKLGAADTTIHKAIVLAETVSMMLTPFLVCFLLNFLVIFEYILGASAEVTRFADRSFYLDWWNSRDWLEFSRKWNVPVHHFLRRHVYFPAMTHMSTGMSLAITFLISSLFHELVMACITKKIRGYGFWMQMSQLPMVAIQRSKYVRNRDTLNNVFFWISIILGTSMICAFYVLL